MPSFLSPQDWKEKEVEGKCLTGRRNICPKLRGSDHDLLNSPSKAYWHTLEDVLIKYIRHTDNKFDYDNEGIAHREHVIADGIRYIGKETNNIDETQTQELTRIYTLSMRISGNSITGFYHWSPGMLRISEHHNNPFTKSKQG